MLCNIWRSTVCWFAASRKNTLWAFVKNVTRDMSLAKEELIEFGKLLHTNPDLGFIF